MIWSTVAPTSQESLISGMVGVLREEVVSVSLHFPLPTLVSLLLCSAGKQWPLGHPATSSSSFLPYWKELPTPIQDGYFSIRGLVFISHVKEKPGKENSKFGFKKDTWEINGKIASDSPQKSFVSIKPCTGVTEQTYLFGQEYPGDSTPQGPGRDLLAGRCLGHPLRPHCPWVLLGLFFLLFCWAVGPPPPQIPLGICWGSIWVLLGFYGDSVAVVPTLPRHISLSRSWGLLPACSPFWVFWWGCGRLTRPGGWRGQGAVVEDE